MGIERKGRKTVGDQYSVGVDTEDNALSFEAVKTHIRQSKEGVVIGFAIDPVECPADLYTIPVGSRFYCSIVQISDDETPVEPIRKARGRKAVDMACMLCRDDRFQAWLYKKNYCLVCSEDAARDGLMVACGISHRSELANNDRARDGFFSLVDEFRMDADKGAI